MNAIWDQIKFLAFSSDRFAFKFSVFYFIYFFFIFLLVSMTFLLCKNWHLTPRPQAKFYFLFFSNDCLSSFRFEKSSVSSSTFGWKVLGIWLEILIFKLLKWLTVADPNGIGPWNWTEPWLSWDSELGTTLNQVFNIWSILRTFKR